MASIYDLKPRFQVLLRPLIRSLARLGITANHVTWTALVLSLGAGAAIAWRPTSRAVLLALPAVLFARMALNAIDGMMARELDMKSALGALLNEIGDVVSDAALYLPLARVPGFEPSLVVVIVVLAGLTETTGILAKVLGGERRYDGPMGKSDRAFVFGAIALALGLGLRPEPWLVPVLVVVAALLVVTVLNRARRTLREAAP
jgi:CDP-diacylglycerol--glycerol-3-phosphate 3-phosphatidyltransferase